MDGPRGDGSADRGGFMMAKVYVSSTVADLKRERQAVIDWLVAAEHQPVHSYRPSGDTVQDACLDDVNGCDLYVLILGYRYGCVPADNNPEGLSITHLEFRRPARPASHGSRCCAPAFSTPTCPAWKTCKRWRCWGSERRSPARSGPRSSAICTA